MAPLGNGQMLLAGTALDGAFNNEPVVVRMNADGSIDNTFGTSCVAALPVTHQDNKFWSVGLQSDGSIVASGHIDQGLTGGGQFNFDVLVARFTAAGALDATFGTAGTVEKPISADLNESAQSMVIAQDDATHLGGYTTLPDFSYRFDSATTLMLLGCNSVLNWFFTQRYSNRWCSPECSPLRLYFL